MDTKNILLIILLMFIAIATGYYVTNGDDEMDAMNAESEMMEEEVMKDDVEAMEAGDVMVADDVMMKDDEMMAAGSYEAYSPDKLVMAENGDVILFFKADWCPTCRALDANLKENVSDIPAGTHILYLDYDTETELRKKYGVTVQHTLVQVAADGSLVAKWNGSRTLGDVLSELQ